jgi:hypothetical protein
MIVNSACLQRRGSGTGKGIFEGSGHGRVLPEGRVIVN